MRRELAQGDDAAGVSIEITSCTLDRGLGRRRGVAILWATTQTTAIARALGVIRAVVEADAGARRPSRRARWAAIDHRRSDGVDEPTVISRITFLDGAPGLGVGQNRRGKGLVGYHG